MSAKTALRDAINEHGIYRTFPGVRIPGKLSGQTYTWQFYLRRVILDHRFGSLVGKVCWDAVRDIFAATPFQLFGVDSAGIPLAMLMQQEAYLEGFEVSVLAGRKESRQYGLLNCTEGPLQGRPLLPVDDLLATGGAAMRQVRAVVGNGATFLPYFLALVDKVGGEYTPQQPRQLPADWQVIAPFNVSDFEMSYNKYLLVNGKVPKFGAVI